jgi:hypothetical protein
MGRGEDLNSVILVLLSVVRLRAERLSQSVGSSLPKGVNRPERRCRINIAPRCRAEERSIGTEVFAMGTPVPGLTTVVRIRPHKIRSDSAGQAYVN